MDLPYFVNGDVGDDHLRGRKVVSNVELHVEKNHGLSFIVFKDYHCCNADKKLVKRETGPESSAESTYIISHDLCSALLALVKASSRPHLYPEFRVQREIPRPYLWAYRERRFIEAEGRRFNGRLREHLSLLFKYIKEHLGAEYARVDGQLKKGVISSDFLEYLFVSCSTKFS